MSNNDEKLTTTTTVIGRITSHEHVSNMVRKLILHDVVTTTTATADETDESMVVMSSVVKASERKQQKVQVLLEGEKHTNISKWMTMKGALQLLAVDVHILVTGNSTVEPSSSSSSIIVIDSVTDIQIRHVRPMSSYLVRLLVYSNSQLHLLFSATATTTTTTNQAENHKTDQHHQQLLLLPDALVNACAPISRNQLTTAAIYCRTEKESGRHAILWKSKQIKNLEFTIYDYQYSHGIVQRGDSTRHSLPRISKSTRTALQSHEQQWCGCCCSPFGTTTTTINENEEANTRRNGSINDINQYKFHLTTQSYTSSSGSNEPISPPPAVVAVDSSSCNNLLLHENIPNPNDERRKKYIQQRKQPQVVWMIHFIQKLLLQQQQQSRRRSIHMVEIGGGRGYLALSVVAAFLRQQQQNNIVHVHVTVIDNNESSLEAGRRQAIAAGLQQSMTFVLHELSSSSSTNFDLSSPSTTTTTTNSPSTIDLVFGLHCCGGLAEAAMEYALYNHASFCISTCCFRSLRHLATLTELAVEITDTSTSKVKDQHCNRVDDSTSGIDKSATNKDASSCAENTTTTCIERVAALAVTVGGQGQHRAIRSYNAMRLHAAEYRFQQLQEDQQQQYTLQVWQECFPVEYSVQNRVLMGCMNLKTK